MDKILSYVYAVVVWVQFNWMQGIPVSFYPFYIADRVCGYDRLFDTRGLPRCGVGHSGLVAGISRICMSLSCILLLCFDALA